MTVLGEILPIAIGLAMLGVMPMIASVVLISSQGGTGKAWLFTAGYLASILVVTGLFVALGEGLDAEDEHAHSGMLRTVIQFVVGVLLLALAYRKFRSRGDTGSDGPAWLAKVDQLSTGRAFLLGAITGGANPKNLALIPGAAVSIVAANIPPAQQALAVAVFAFIGSAGVALPLIIPIVTGARSDQVLHSMREWLTRNSAVIMMVLLFILGWVLIGRGLSGL